MSTEPNPGYDPEPDLEALHATRGAKVAVGFMLATAACELGSFLQYLSSYVIAPPWVTAWAWSKLLVIGLALYAAHVVSNLHPRALAIWVGVSVLALADGLGWFLFSWSEGLFSCFSPLVVVPAVVTLLASGVVKAEVKRAELARGHLRESGLGEGF